MAHIKNIHKAIHLEIFPTKDISNDTWNNDLESDFWIPGTSIKDTTDSEQNTVNNCQPAPSKSTAHNDEMRTNASKIDIDACDRELVTFEKSEVNWK